MTKITPEPLEEKKTGLEGLLNEEETSSQQEEKEIKERNFFLRFILSIRLFLIVMITLVVLLTAISIWVTAYTMNEQAALEQVDIIITNMNEKISSFVNSQLLPAKYVADSMVNDYYNGYIDMVDTIRPYMFERVKTFGVTVTNLCFGEQGYNSLFAYSVTADGSIVYVTKRQNERFIMYRANITTGEYYPDKIMANITYSVDATDYYIESVALMKNYPTGAFGAPYKVINGPQSTYWSTPVYNKTELPEKKNRIGFAKINISLAAIAQFLATVKVMEKGFVIISEYENDYVIGSSLNIEGIDDKRIKATNVTTRGAGTIMSKLLKYQSDKSLSNTERIVTTFTNDNSELFLVSSSPYIFYNLQWRMTLVFDENEIKKGIIQSSYVILGVSIGVGVLGIIVSVFIGWSVTSPFIKLQKDFKKIEILDLVNIKQRSSIFSESNSIYSSLSETVRWLSEIRAFLPESVLHQLEMTKQTMQEASEKKETHEPGLSFKVSTSTMQKTGESKSNLSDSSDRHSKIDGKHDSHTANNLFKLGLFTKECSIIYMTFPNLDEENYGYESGLLSNLISKALTSISSICKTCKADFQIKSYNEFVIVFSDKNPPISALETSLKIVTLLNSLNETISKDGHPNIKMCASVTSGNTIMGNVGSKQMRYFAMLGRVMNRGKALNDFSNFLDIQVLCDQATQQKAKDSFIFRPVERIVGEHHHIQTVYQLVKRNIVHDDEWFYELEQKKANAKFDEFNADFSKVFESETLGEFDMELILSHLVESSQNHPNDRVIKRFEQLISESKLKKEHNLQNYYTIVAKQFVSFVRPCEPLQSSIPYSHNYEE